MSTRLLDYLGLTADELATVVGTPLGFGQYLSAELGISQYTELLPSELATIAESASSLAAQSAQEEADMDVVRQDLQAVFTALLAVANDGVDVDLGGITADDLRDALVRIPEVVLLRGLHRTWPDVFDSLVVVGAVVQAPVNPALDIDRLNALAGAPLATFADHVWPELLSAGDDRVLAALGRVLRRHGIPASIQDRWPVTNDAEQLIGEGALPDAKQLTIPILDLDTDPATTSAGIIVSPAAVSNPSAPDGFLVTNYADAAAEITSDGDGVTLRASVTGDANHAVLGALSPAGLDLMLSDPSAGAELSLLVPAAGGADAAVRVGGVEALLSATGPALLARLRTLSVDGYDSGVVIHFAIPEPDGFLASIIGDATITGQANLGIAWSSDAGLSIEAAAGLRFETFPAPVPGPFSILRAAVALEAGTNGLQASVDVDLRAAVGPITVVVDRIGIYGTVTRAPDGDGALGALDVEWGALWPQGLGFTVDLPAVQGGGRIGFDPAHRRYYGIAKLRLVEEIGLTAVVEVTTGTEANPHDWSFLVALSLNFGPITLPYGFFLLGAGGLLGLNRAFNADELGQRLSSGALESIMFPPDPIGQAPQVLQDLRTVFPTSPGDHVFGPFVRIGWGGPKPFLQVDLGLLIAIPDIAIGLVANARFQIPPIGTPEPVPQPGEDPPRYWPIVGINLAVLGVLDLAAKEVWVKGSIYDSRVVGVELSGDTAFFARFDDEPFFLLSVGGYHPDWTPPATLPQALQTLARTRAHLEIDENLVVDISGYFALTTNTLQAGAEFSLLAVAKVGAWTFGIEGHSEFHAIAEFTPFSFDVRWYLEVAILAGSGELMAAALSARVQGPDPWIVEGSAEFRFLSQDLTARVRIEGTPRNVPLPSVDVLADVLAALANPTAWRVPAAAMRAVLHPDLTLGDVPYAAPHASLEVTQSAVPLDIAIDRVGESRPAGANTFTLTGVELGSDALDPDELQTAFGAFPPTRYWDLDRNERLRAPSVEEHAAGTVIASGTISAADSAPIPTGWDQEVIDPRYRAGTPKVPPATPPCRPGRIRIAGGPRLVIEEAVWTARTGDIATTHRTFAEAVVAAREVPGVSRLEDAR